MRNPDFQHCIMVAPNYPCANENLAFIANDKDSGAPRMWKTGANNGKRGINQIALFDKPLLHMALAPIFR